LNSQSLFSYLRNKSSFSLSDIDYLVQVRTSVILSEPLNIVKVVWLNSEQLDSASLEFFSLTYFAEVVEVDDSGTVPKLFPAGQMFSYSGVIVTVVQLHE